MMTKFTRTLPWQILIVSLFCSQLCLADVELVDVIAMGHNPIEVQLSDGTLLTGVPIQEYKRLDSWNSSVGISRATSFDVVAILFNHSLIDSDEVTVRFSIYADVRDFNRESAELERIEIDFPGEDTITSVVAGGQSATAIIRDVDLEAIWTRFGQERKWPYMLEVVAELECEDCTGDISLVKTHSWKMVPGD